MATLNELKKYLTYTFSSGCYTGEDYKSFERKYINYLKAMCKKQGWEFVGASKNHYEFTAFIKQGEKYVYFSISDVRFFKNEWYNHILIRTAQHERDFHGGPNCYSSLEELPKRMAVLFTR